VKLFCAWGRVKKYSFCFLSLFFILSISVAWVSAPDEDVAGSSKCLVPALTVGDLPDLMSGLYDDYTLAGASFSVLSSWAQVKYCGDNGEGGRNLEAMSKQASFKLLCLTPQPFQSSSDRKIACFHYVFLSYLPRTSWAD